MRYLVVALVLAGCIVGDEREDERAQNAGTWGIYDPQPGHPTLAERDSFVAEVSAYAREAEAQYGVPAAAIAAMTCNESGFGWTRIALNANNLFGWKWTSYDAAGGREPWTLVGQPASDPNNKYVRFADRRDAVLFVAAKLAQNARYKPSTDRYQTDLASGVDVVTAANTWIRGIAFAGYNPYEHYSNTTIKFMNDYRSPSTTFSPAYNLYRFSPAVRETWISIDAPAANATVHGDVTLASSVGDATITNVSFATRAQGATDWYALGEDTAAPYSRTWPTAGWVTNGTYELRAQAWSGTTLRATGVITVSVAN